MSDIFCLYTLGNENFISTRMSQSFIILMPPPPTQESQIILLHGKIDSRVTTKPFLAVLNDSFIMLIVA